MAENTPTTTATTASPENESPNDNPKAATTNAEKDPEAAKTEEKNESTHSKSILYRMKHAHLNASTPWEFMKSFFLILFHTIGFLIIMGVLLGVPIAMIVIGVIERNSCRAERFVPIWLYVSGAFFGFMQLIFMIRATCKMVKGGEPPEKSEVSKSYSCFNLLLTLFSFAWFIAGNIWVFRIFQPNTTDVNSPAYCHHLPYYFSFVIIIVAYVWMFLICCFSSCVACVGIHASSNKNKSGNEEAAASNKE